VKKKIVLVDSNAYFRLFLHLTPFLGRSIFGKFVFYILSDLEKEYQRSNRLQSKFEHFMKPEYVEDRKNTVPVKDLDIIKIDGYFEFIKSSARQMNLTVSPVDIRYLAYCYNFKCAVVTDDIEMRELAEELDITTYSLLEILGILKNLNFITIEKVREIVGHMKWNNDLSENNIEQKYRDLFNEELPDYP